MKFIFFTLFLCISIYSKAQVMDSTNIPYHQIPEYSQKYSMGAITARLVDGLGYRFYWASKDLGEIDLKYTPSESGKSTLETLEHIYDLALTINNVAKDLPNIRPYSRPKMTYAEMREKTLVNLKEASEIFLEKSDQEIEFSLVIFQNKENKIEYPFWNFLNGQLSDAIYHTGQLVTFRRSSGNPVQSGVNVFIGKTKD